MASHPDYPRTRLYVEHALHANVSFSLTREQTHYLHNVLRLKTGDAVAVFNGRDGEWLTRINHLKKSTAGLQVEKRLRPQKAAPDGWLLFAPLKGGKTEFIAEKATELGVAYLQPVFTAHSVVTRVNRERLVKIAVEASEQCERIDVPQVRETANLTDVLQGSGFGIQDSGKRLLLFCDESGRGENPLTLLPRILNPESRIPFAILTGPEGGFSAKELDLLHALPYAKPLSLGPRILRADTAAVAALACVMSHLGDWDDKPAFRTI